jgi:hypothetical protein
MNDELTLRFAALADQHDDSDWLDVRRRAGLRRSRARIVPLAAALVALVVGSAFVYYRDAVDFFAAEKAPREYVEFIESFSVAAPPGMDPQAIAEETRRIELAGPSGSSATLFLAPTKAGGFCQAWDAPLSVGGCQPGAETLGLSMTAVRDRGSWLLATVGPKYVARVELWFDDGAVIELPITWISPPIDHGFAFHLFERGERKRLESVVGLDEDGAVVRREELRVRQEGPPADAVFADRTAAIEVLSGSGPAVMWSAPTRYGRRCTWVELERVHDPYCTLPLHVRSTPQTVLVYGRVGEDDATIDLRYADGESEAITAEDGLFLFEIRADHLEAETALMSMTVRGADLEKEPWLSMTFDAKTSCRPLPLPEGHSCPWGP